VNLQAPELLIILAVVLLLFGAKKLPELAKSLGHAQREFKEGMKDGDKPKEAAAEPTPPPATDQLASPDVSSATPDNDTAGPDAT
jgi:sec-independent protein translocase protein TatA